MIDKLKRWISGDADWKVEQELDRKAVDDQFLSDALDGYRSFADKDHEKNIAALKAKLKKQERSTLVIPLWGRIAAAAIVIGLIAIPITLRYNPAESGEIAVVETTPIEEKQTPAKDLSPNITLDRESKEFTISEKENIESEPELVQEELAFTYEAPRQNIPAPKVDPANIEAGIMEESDLEETEIADSKVEEVRGDNTPPVDTNETIADSYKSEIAEDEAPAELSEVVVVADEEIEPVVVPAESINKEAAKKAKRITEAVAGAPSTAQREREFKTLRGIVQTENTNEVLIGVNVLLKESNEGVVTDIDGSFSLRSNQALPWTLVITYIGFDEKEVLIESLDETSVTIFLEENQIALESVEVTAARIQSDKRNAAVLTTEDLDAIEIKPATKEVKTNFRKLKRHIRKKLNYPEAARENNIEGTVRLRFSIASDGTPENFTVLESLGYGCDEEAIRLLKEGPKWRPAYQSTEYSIEFKK